MKGLNVNDVLPDDARKQSELTVLQYQLQAVTGELGEITQKIENLDDAIDSTDNKVQRDRHLLRQGKLIYKVTELENEQSELDRKINQLRNAEKNIEKRLKDIQQLITLINDSEDKQKIDIRINLNQHLKQNT
jgi:chaperonin cofactor prefoldin